MAEIIRYTTKERDEAIRSILVLGHPVYQQLKELAEIPIRPFFVNKAELDLFMSTFNYSRAESTETFHRYISNEFGSETTIEIDVSIFDDSGSIRQIAPEDLGKSYVKVKRVDTGNDEVPF